MKPKHIQDDIIIVDNQLISILDVQPIKYHLLSNKEKADLTKEYIEWIESLNHPIQIVCRTVNADLSERIKIIKNKVQHEIKQKEESKKLLEEFNEFSLWLDKYLSKSKIEKKYYIMIPFSPSTSFVDNIFTSKKNYKDNLEILNERTNECILMLQEMGMKAKRLCTNELKELFSSYLSVYNYEKTYKTPREWVKEWEHAK